MQGALCTALRLSVCPSISVSLCIASLSLSGLFLFLSISIPLWSSLLLGFLVAFPLSLWPHSLCFSVSPFVGVTISGFLGPHGAGQGKTSTCSTPCPWNWFTRGLSWKLLGPEWVRVHQEKLPHVPTSSDAGTQGSSMRGHPDQGSVSPSQSPPGLSQLLLPLSPST